MNALRALALKDLKLILRDKAGFFFTFIFPIAYAIFFGSIFGGSGSGGDNSPGIKVMLVDLDQSEGSRAFAATLTAASELNVKAASTMAQAELAVNNKQAAAVITLMPGFGKGQENLLWPTGEKSTIEVATDPSRSAEIGMLQGLLQKYTFQSLGSTLNDPKSGRRQIDSVRKQLAADKDVKAEDRLLLSTFFNATDLFLAGMDQRARDAGDPAGADSGNVSASRGLAFEPVKVTTRKLVRQSKGPPNAFTISFPQGIIWGVMGAALGFATSLIGERTGGTYARLAVAPIPVGGVLGGKALACFITMVSVTALMLAVGVAIFKVTIANPLMLIVAVVAVSLCYCGIMTLVATLARTERSAAGSGWAVMMVFAFIGGAAIPSFVMPGWMQNISQFSPVYWAITMFEGGLWRELSTATIATALAVLLGIAAVGFGLGSASVRRG